MGANVHLTPDQVRAIRRDYAERNPNGKFRYPVLDVAVRHGVSQTVVNRVAKTWGLRRNCCSGARAG